MPQPPSTPKAPESGLQVAWPHVSIDYPPGHEKTGNLVLQQNDLVPSWYPQWRADILVSVGAFRRAIILDTETGKYAVASRSITAEERIRPEPPPQPLPERKPTASK